MTKRGTDEPLYEKPLPNSIDSERAILGAIILDNAVFWQARQFGVTADWFYHPSFVRVWRAMEILADSGSEINPILINEVLKHEGIPVELTVISNLTYGLPHFANITQYAKIVRDKYWMRQQVKTLTNLITMTLEEEYELADLMTRTESEVLGLVSNALRGHKKQRSIDYVHILDDKQDFVETLEKRSSGISDAIPNREN